MTLNRQWLLKARPHGMIGPDNFEYTETPIPQIGDGEILVQNQYLSFDPTQRNWMVDRPGYLPPVGIGEVMRAGSVSEVVESKHPDFKPGELVQTTGCWQDFAVVAPGKGPMGVNKLPPGVSPEMMLSILGITGMTAYFGLLDHGQPGRRRDRAGIRRRGRHGISRGTNRQAQGVPHHRHRRWREKMRLAHRRGQV